MQPSANARPAELETFERFCSQIVLPDGKAMKLEPFQQQLLTDYFDGVRETLILIPKKNGKSSLLAVLAIYHLLTTPDAACYVGASSRDQAKIMFDEAVKIIRRTPWLTERSGKFGDGMLQIQDGYKRILNTADSGAMRVLAADANTADGVIPTLALVDELHRHRSSDLYAVFRDGLGPRQGQMITISTAGDDLDSPLGRIRSDARKLSGLKTTGAYHYARSGSLAYHEYALDPTANRDDLELVKQANPASWQTREELKIRQESSTMRSWEWARFACGVWVYGEDTAITDTEWRSCADRKVRIPDGAQGVMVGIDVGLRRDTTAIVPVWQESQESQIIVHPPAIIVPPDEGATTFKTILAAIEKFGAKWSDMTVVIDPNAGGEILADRIENDLGFDVVIHSQQPQPMAMAAERLVSAIGEGQLVHPDDPELNRHILSATAKTVGESWRFDKSKKRNVPNDGAIALAMAVSQVVAPTNGPSVYEEREMVIL